MTSLPTAVQSQKPPPTAPVQSSTPSPIRPELARALAYSCSAIVDDDGVYRYTDRDREPDTATRRSLTSRRSELSMAFSQRDRPALAQALAALFTTMRVQAGNPADVIAAYIAVLDPLPTWATVEACRAAARGRSLSLVFAPTAAELYTAAEAILIPLRMEESKISAVLMAEPAGTISREGQERVAHGFDALATEMAQSAVAIVSDAKRRHVEAVRKANKQLGGLELPEVAKVEGEDPEARRARYASQPAIPVSKTLAARTTVDAP